ncbi:MAG: hypothetical protein KJ697_02730 [Nanoarchaeota archaeon]|nr:hypothetical protein [Nanoarchaeota archaeon]
MVEIVNPITKKHLILLTYKVMNGVDYDEMHRAVKGFQDVLEKRYGKTLGYKFQDLSIYKYWDNQFQMDIEAFEFIDGVVVKEDIQIPGSSEYNFDLKLSDMGVDICEILSSPHLKREFNDKRITKKLLRELKKIKKEIAS